MTLPPIGSAAETVPLHAVDAAPAAYRELAETGLSDSAWMARVLIAARDAPPGAPLVDTEGMLHPATPALAEYVKA